MFEKAMDSLVREHHELLNRIDKGKKKIEEASIAGESEELRSGYVKQIKYLQNLALRASTCVDILNGEVILIAQAADEVLVAKRLDVKMNHLVKEAVKLGGVITRIEEA